MRDAMVKPAHGLDNLSVAPASLLADADDRVGDAFVGPGRPGLLSGLDFGRFVGPSSNFPNQRRNVE